MASKRTELIEGLSFLKDSSIGQRKFTWYRNGERGHLHGRRGCWKLKFPSSVTLSLGEAFTRKGCETCFSYALNSISEAYEEMTRLRDAQIKLEQASALVAAENPADASRVLDIGRQISEDLEALGLPEHCHAYVHTATIEEANSIALQATSILSQSQDTILAHAGADLRTTLVGKERRNYAQYWDTPGLTEEMSERAGNIANGHELNPAYQFGYGRRPVHGVAYAVWHSNRLAGKSSETAAAEAEAIVIKHARLSELEQLEGVTLEANQTPLGVLEAAEEAWRAQVQQDIRALTRHWENKYAEVRNKRETVTVGIETQSWGESDELMAAVRAFPHAQSGNRTVGNFPQTVAWWICGKTDDAHIATRIVSDDQLSTAALLWEPGSQGAYAVFDVAAQAATVL